MNNINIIPIKNLPEFSPKHDLADELIKGFENNNIALEDNDVIVVTQKIVSKVENRLIENNSENIEENSLLIFDNNLSFEFTDFKNKKFKKIYLISNRNRSIKLSEKVMKFKSLLINDQEHRLKEQSINCEIIDINEIKNIDEKIIGLYPNVGENLDYLNTNNLNLNFLYRKLDQYSWQYCNKGFFNFKNYIPKIIATFS